MDMMSAYQNTDITLGENEIRNNGNRNEDIRPDKTLGISGTTLRRNELQIISNDGFSYEFHANAAKQLSFLQ